MKDFFPNKSERTKARNSILEFFIFPEHLEHATTETKSPPPPPDFEFQIFYRSPAKIRLIVLLGRRPISRTIANIHEPNHFKL